MKAKSIAAALLAFLLLVLVVPGQASARVIPAACKKTLTVNDAGDAGVRGQLRGAIADVCDGGTIIVRPGILIGLQQGELVIPLGKTVTIRNPSQGHSPRPAVVIDAHGASRVIWVQAGAHLMLESVVVRGGSNGGINNEGFLTIVGGTVTGNTGFGIVNAGGTVRLVEDAAVAANQGTGVLNQSFSSFVVGQLFLEDDSTITGNSAGGIANAGGVVTLNDSSSITRNVAATGGGILNQPCPCAGGLVTLNDDSIISGNEAGRGGGIYNDFSSFGGGVDVLNDRSRISDNVASDGGGVAGRGQVILNDDSAIASNTGGGISIIRGNVILNDRSTVANNQGVGVSVGLAGGVGLNDESTIVGNTGPGVSASIAIGVTLNGSSRISENEGGGVVADFGSGVTLNGSSSISGNTNHNGGGGISSQSAVSVVLNDDSSVAGNVAPFGGGIFNGGPVESSVTLNDNSRITGNTATDGLGGGIYSENGSVTINDAGAITGNVPDNCFPNAICP